MNYPITPDGRYFVVKGRLWRCSNPNLNEQTRLEKVRALMQGRRAVKQALQQSDMNSLAIARQQVNEAKIALGERGAVWWKDGAPDYTRRMVEKTPYAEWYASYSRSR
ncbi:MAG: hypothetical protein HC827_10280 [Cyanobacteria bacterium RM1_2_2]|nr:hypothetical protein [Cyanobacteria bacterium RM1_2_2]